MHRRTLDSNFLVMDLVKLSLDGNLQDSRSVLIIEETSTINPQQSIGHQALTVEHCSMSN